jgi:GR25 family glycosyltransferase involved in LPS biosynthesis
MKAICLNLDSRPDRWELAQKEFKEHGLNVERFAAIPNVDRFLSFNLSQQAILQSIT